MDIFTNDFKICGDMLIDLDMNIGVTSDNWRLHVYDSDTGEYIIENVAITPTVVQHMAAPDEDPYRVLHVDRILITIVLRAGEIYFVSASSYDLKSSFETNLEPFERYLKNACKN